MGKLRPERQKHGQGLVSQPPRWNQTQPQGSKFGVLSTVPESSGRIGLWPGQSQGRRAPWPVKTETDRRVNTHGMVPAAHAKERGGRRVTGCPRHRGRAGQNDSQLQACQGSRGGQRFGVSAPHRNKSFLGPHIKYIATHHHSNSLIMF